MALHVTNAVVIYDTWPSSGTTVTNNGTGGATYNGTEHTNHYTTTPSYATAQRFLLAADYVSYPHGAAVNNLSAFTLELLWLASSGTGDVNFFTKYLSGGVNVTYIAASSRLYIKRGTTTGSGYETWYCAFTPVNGSWYDIQVSWGTIGSTPIIKINNSSQSLTHDSTGTGAWNDDSVYNGVFIYNGTANAGTLTIVRVHNTNLSTSDLSDNYAVDWARTHLPDTIITGVPVSIEHGIVAGSKVLGYIIAPAPISTEYGIVAGTTVEGYVIAGAIISTAYEVEVGYPSGIPVIGALITTEYGVIGGDIIRLLPHDLEETDIIGEYLDETNITVVFR